jgi:ABC-type amino acid transport system permease subunit
MNLVFQGMLRVIIPPLISQYLNITKTHVCDCGGLHGSSGHAMASANCRELECMVLLMMTHLIIKLIT